jgi:mannose-6-phosphate isomerase-like protein (cupin superfamily)
MELQRMSRDKLIRLLCVLTGVVCGAAQAQTPDPIVRRELYTAEIGERMISKVAVKEIDFKPRQQTGPHQHPCPVISYIVSGSVTFQIEGQPAQTLHAGQVVYEPANTVIVQFDNPSKTEGSKFIPYYLLKGDEKSLIEMLPLR